MPSGSTPPPPGTGPAGPTGSKHPVEDFLFTYYANSVYGAAAMASRSGVRLAEAARRPSGRRGGTTASTAAPSPSTSTPTSRAW